MAQVTLKINGRSYVIACDDGQEAHLTQVAEYLDRRVTELAAGVGQIGEARLLVMASLLVVDELLDKTQQLTEARDQEAVALEQESQNETLALLDQMVGRVDALVERAQGA
ncbi:cell division protein ZapA [Rhodovibrionaceae bacterium A322]